MTIHFYPLKIRGKELSHVFPDLAFSLEYCLLSSVVLRVLGQFVYRCVLHFFPVLLVPYGVQIKDIAGICYGEKFFQNCSRESGKWIVSTSLT